MERRRVQKDWTPMIIDTQELDFKQSRAVIVGIMLAAESEASSADDLDELESLLRTLGVTVCGRVQQKRQKLSPGTLLGSGKVEEVKNVADMQEADFVVFDRTLSGPQMRNLETLLCKPVMDRTGVILEIFSRHARSNQAKTQVEIARLEYLLPRLTGAWTHFQRQTGGGVRSRGMGEKQIEIDRRRARERIVRLQKQLEQISKEKQTQRKARLSELKVALVGYTNSGKTTLMRSLTKATIKARDELFATLDTNIKTIDPRTNPKILLSDTVGFIRNLPHSLVESFKSTLDEVSEADLLLHVVDVSHENYKSHMEVTREVLTEIGAGDIPQMMIFNKLDRLNDPMLPKVLHAAYPNSMCLSAIDPDDVLSLRDHVYRFFRRNLVTYEVVVSVEDQELNSMIHRDCLILKSNYEQPPVVTYRLKSTTAIQSRLLKMIELRRSKKQKDSSGEEDNAEKSADPDSKHLSSL